MGLSRRIGTGFGATSQLVVPTAASGLWDLRLHTSQAVTFVNALIADPTARATYFPDVRLALLVTDPTAASELTSALDVVTKARTIGIRVTMGVRLMALAGYTTFVNGWLNPAVWQANATNVEVLFGLLGQYLTDDWLQLDCEGYAITDQDAPTTEAFANAVANPGAVTVAGFRAIIDPFLRAVVSTGLRPYMYPAVATDEFMPLVIAATGRGVVSCENSFGHDVFLRTDPLIGYPSQVANQVATYAAIQVKCGPNAELRPACRDNVIRRWGVSMRPLEGFSSLGQGSEPGWLFLRTNTDLATIGTAAWYNGTALKSYNDAEYVWTLPNLHKGNVTLSYGMAATPLQLSSSRESPTGNTIFPAPRLASDEGGVRFDTPIVVAGSTHMAYRADCFPASGNAKQYTWTVRVRFQIPTGAVDAPIFSQAQYNVGVWQVAKIGNDIVLQINTDTPRVIVANYVADTTYTVLISRASISSWFYAVNGAARVAVTKSLASASDHFVLGAGQTPATFATNNTQAGMQNVLFKDDVVVWWRSLTDAEGIAASTGTWPWGLL